MERTHLVVKGIRIAFGNLLIVAIIGCLLRFFFLYPLPGFNYSYMLHAHSHLALLGWVFMALFVLILHAYLPIEATKYQKYIYYFIILQLANVGMLFTFPFTGYALWSIIFSAIHALMAMLFAWVFILEVDKSITDQHRTSFRFIKWALILLFISNLAPFALGPVSVTQGKADLYYSLIYFYLHFQYNGWFTFVLLGLLLHQLEKQGVNTDHKLVKLGFLLKLLAVFPAYLLSVLWTSPGLIWNILCGVAAITQLVGLVLNLVFVMRYLSVLFGAHSGVTKMLFFIGAVAVCVQHVLMLLSAFPTLSDMAFARNIVIAYLHLVLLGFVTIWIFYQLMYQRVIKVFLLSEMGVGLFFMAFLATEFILIFQGMLDSATYWLFILAILQLCGIALITASIRKHKVVA